MKYLVLLVYCLGVQGNKEDINPPCCEYEGQILQEYKESINPAFDTRIVHRDEIVSNEKYFYRPCASLDDWECIRQFLAEHSDCKPAYGQAPDPLYLPRNTVFFSLVNMTNILAENTITGLNSSKIVECFYNKKIHNLVLAIEVTNLNETIQKSIYRYRRTLKEPIVLTDFATVLFKRVIITCIIPKINKKLRLDLAECFADIKEDYPAFFVGDKAYASKDPDVIEAFKEFQILWPMILRQAISTQVNCFEELFIQCALCDFGHKPKCII